MRQEKGTIVVTEADRQELITLNRLDELLTPRSIEEVIKVAALTRYAARRRQDPEVLRKEKVERIHIESIKQAQDEEVQIKQLNLYMTEYRNMFIAAEKRTIALIAPNYEVDEGGVLYFCPRSTPTGDRTEMMRLVHQRCCRKISYTTSTPVWKADIKGSAGHTSASDIDFTGEVCAKLYRGI